MRTNFGVLQQTHGLRLRAKFPLDRFILTPSGGEKPHLLPFIGLQHLVVSPMGSSLRKLDMGAQLQAFPYPTVSKLFLYYNAFMAKSGAQSLMFKSVTDKETNRETDKQAGWLHPQVRMTPARNARRTSCPIPSSERAQIPNFRTRFIPKL